MGKLTEKKLIEMAEEMKRQLIPEPDFPPEPVQTIGETTEYFSGYSKEEISKIVNVFLRVLEEQGITLTDDERAEIISNSAPGLGCERIITLGEALGADASIYKTAADRVLEDFFYEPYLWIFVRRYLKRINCLRKQAGLKPIRKDSPLVVSIIARGLQDENSYDFPRNVRQFLREYKWTLLRLVKLLQKYHLEEGLAPERNPRANLTQLYLRSILERNLSKEEVEKELDKHKLLRSSIVGWKALLFEAKGRAEQLSDYIFLSRENLFELLQLQELFSPLREMTKERLRRGARLLLEDSYTRESDVAFFKERGYSLYKIAGVPPDSLEELEGPTPEELREIEEEM